MSRTYRGTVTYRAVMHDVELNGKVYSCTIKRILPATAEEENAILEAEKKRLNDDTLYLGNYDWEIWS